MAEIGVDEWRALLESLEVEAGPDDARTTMEWQRVFGRGMDWTRATIRRGLELGLVERVPGLNRKTMAGQWTTVMGYRLLAEPKG